LLKERIHQNKEEIRDNNHEITLLKTKIHSAEEHNAELEHIKKTEVSKLKIKVKEHLDTIDKNENIIKECEAKVIELSESMSDKESKKNKSTKMTEILYDLTSKKTISTKELKFYTDHDNCPTCKQGIDQDFKRTTVSDKTAKIAELDAAIIKLQAKQNETNARLTEIAETEASLRKHRNKANENHLAVKMTMGQLQVIKKELIGAERDVEEIDLTKINEFNKELRGYQKKQTDLYDKREVLSIVSAMLKDGGIKTSIIRTYIPIMNKIINQYLAEFELFVDFNLDENFNETIKSRFRDKFSFSSFSEGEKMRINLSIMFAWRALAKLRNSVSTNLLLLDEVLDSGSDAQGVESLIDILHKMHAKDNIFVISHRGSEFGERFGRTLRFEKVKNFTQLA